MEQNFKIHVSLILGLLFLFFIIFFIRTTQIENKFKNETITSKLTNTNKNGLEKISLEELEILVESEISYILYLGNDDCPKCEEIEPLLTDYLETNFKKSFYYNIDYTNKKNKNKVAEIIKTLEINAVPLLLEINNGNKIEKKYYSKDIMEKYMK